MTEGLVVSPPCPPLRPLLFSLKQRQERTKSLSQQEYTQAENDEVAQKALPWDDDDDSVSALLACYSLFS